MASKRNFKKQLNYMIFDVVEECYSIQLYNEKKTEVTNKLIDEAIEFRNNMMSRVHQTKSKKDFPVLREEAENASVDFVHKMNEIQ